MLSYNVNKIMEKLKSGEKDELYSSKPLLNVV